MLDIANAGELDTLLDAVSQQLARAARHYELVIVGGSALLAFGLINHPTRDVDVVALRQADALLPAEPCLRRCWKHEIASAATLGFLRIGSTRVRRGWWSSGSRSGSSIAWRRGATVPA